MRVSTLVLTCACVAATAASAWLWEQWQDERVLNLQKHASMAQCPDAPTPPPPPPLGRSGFPAIGANQLHAEEPANEAPPVAATPRRRFTREMQQKLLKDPEFREALGRQQRQAIAEAYRDLPGLMGLTPQQADRLFDLLRDQTLKGQEMQWQKPADGKTWQSVYQEMRARNDADLTELLGASNMTRLQEFRATQESRAEVNTVRNELARSAEPMRPDQVEPLVAVVNVELQRMKQEMADAGTPEYGNVGDTAGDTKRSEFMIAANQRIVDASRPILSGVQLAALEDLYRNQRLQMETQNTLSRIRDEAMTNEAATATPH